MGRGGGGCTHPTLCSYAYDKKRKLNFLPAVLACLKPCIQEVKWLLYISWKETVSFPAYLFISSLISCHL